MVRIWRLPVEFLDRQHLLGEHLETHIIFNALLKLVAGERAGWQRHPQTLRFADYIGMLIDRHNQQIREMRHRGYNHNSPLPQTNQKSEPYRYSYIGFALDYRTLFDRDGMNRKLYKGASK